MKLYFSPIYVIVVGGGGDGVVCLYIMCACACVSFVLTYNGLENSSATSTKQESLHYARNILKI